MTKRGKGKQHKQKRRGGSAAPLAPAKGAGGSGRPGAAAKGTGAAAAASETGAAPRRRPGLGAGGRPGARRLASRGPPSPSGEQSLPPAALSGALEKARDETRARIQTWLRAGDEMRRRLPAEGAAGNLDPWQQEVLDALVCGQSVVVDAPTTAGKTRAVEAFFRANLANPLFRAAYTTPVKSLSNDKLREFRDMFGRDNVGIATGDIKENLGAPIVVATLESYRNSLLGVEPDLGRTLVVFDEYHYLQDESRGSAWEEALILTPAHCQVLLLSASVANAEDFVAWLRSLKGPGDAGGRPCVLVRTERRPVPLAPLVYYGRDWLLADTLPAGVLRPTGAKREDVPVRQEELGERAAQLVKLGLTPAIIYCGRRLACETMAGLLCRHLPLLATAEAELIGASLETSQKEFKGLSFITPKLRHMLQVYGVGFHHSGLAPPARMAIEQLVKNGLLRFCTATMGLSLGINFSVRSALISDYQRPGELGFTDYSPSEVLQMLGRAGRRGKDEVGFSLWASPEAMARLGGAKRDAIVSRLRNDPTTFLGLVGRGYDLAAIEAFYSRSFRRFKNQNVDLSLITKARLMKRLEARDLPCGSPAAEIARFWNEGPSACPACPYRERCHPLLEAKSAGSLTALHLHLHSIGALNRDESLSEFGTVARYFPQAGGLVMARLITDGRINADNLQRAAELAAALGLARFKEPGGDPRYRLPFAPDEIEALLEASYPFELFEEIYDPPFKSRTYPVIREFNPAAGYVVREWMSGTPWKELAQIVTTEQYGTGDMMGLLYRAATYMQSIAQAGIPGLAELARVHRDALLREPMSLTLTL